MRVRDRGSDSGGLACVKKPISRTLIHTSAARSVERNAWVSFLYLLSSFVVFSSSFFSSLTSKHTSDVGPWFAYVVELAGVV